MGEARTDTWMPLYIGDTCWPRGKWLIFRPWDISLPESPGVYVIFLDREPLYIGQSNNIRARLARHNIRYGYARNIKTPWGDFPDDVNLRVKIKLSRRIGDWAMQEIRLIHRLQPRFNFTYGSQRARGLR